MWKNQSKFRFVEIRDGKEEAKGLRVAKPNSPGHCIAVSSSWIVFPMGDVGGGTLGCIRRRPLDGQGKDVVSLAGHQAAIASISSSPFDDNVFFSTSKDGSVKLWNVEKSPHAIQSLAIDSKGVLSYAPHPSCPDVGLCGSAGGTHLVNWSTGSIVSSTSRPNNDAVAWTVNGSKALCLFGDNQVVLYDPRSKSSSAQWTLDMKKGSHIIVLDAIGRFAVFGRDQFRKTKCLVFDINVEGKPLFSTQVSSSSGVCLPLYDWDTQLLSVASKGSNTLNVFDIHASLQAGELRQVESFIASSQFQGLASLPKHNLSVFDQEVACLYGLHAQSIKPISFHVKRKTRGFYDELFPDTFSKEPSMTVAEYLNGEDRKPHLVSLRPKVESFNKDVKANAKLQPAAPKAVSKAEEQVRSETRSGNTKCLPASFKKNSFATMKGKVPLSKEASWYKIKPQASATALGENLVCNTKYLVFPWVSFAGAAVIALRLDTPGRVPDQTCLFRVHDEGVTALQISPHRDTFYTASTDAQIRMWEIPEVMPHHDIKEPSNSVNALGKVNCIALHPTAEDIVAASSTNMGSHAVQLFDMDAETCLWSMEMQHHVDSIAFSPSGSLMAVSDKQGLVSVYDPRQGTTTLATCSSLESLRSVGLLWVSEGHLITYGFTKGSVRQFTIWKLDDETHTMTSMATHTLDVSNSQLKLHYDEDIQVLFVHAKGDRIIRYFSLHLSPTVSIDVLSAYTDNAPLKGLAWAHKTELNVADVEVARAYRMTDTDIKPLSFTLSRKRKEFFQDDVFPASRSLWPLYTSSAWWAGEHTGPVYKSLQPKGMQNLSEAPEEDFTERQRHRIAMLANMEEEKKKPSMHEHFDSITSTDFKSQTQNRWDAVPVQEHISDDEWED